MDFSWIQISDLHLFDNTETKVIENAFKKIAEKERINFIVVTGDLHQYRDNYNKTNEFLEAARNSFCLEKSDIFIVPGNHDSGDCKKKKQITYYIEHNVDEDQDCYVEDFTTDGLVDCFNDYNSFIKAYYGINNPYDNPEQVCILSWNNQINIIHLNSAINCNGDNTLSQIVDIHTLSLMSKDNYSSLPSIIIAHHPFSSLHISHQDFLRRFITDWKISAYLCGDLHKVYEKRIKTHTGSGTSIPCIVCAKTTPETKDTYSDLGFILYKKQNEMVRVHPYEWSLKNKRFDESSCMNTDRGSLDFPLCIEKPLFSSSSNELGELGNESTDSQIIIEDKNDNDCIWLPDAEFADGIQARFNSYTKTSIIQDYLRDDSWVWGLSAVRGVGKTFILQVLRSKIKSDKLKLPVGRIPSKENGWGTETINLNSLEDYSGLRNFKNVVIMWQYCISAYVINQMINYEKKAKGSELSDVSKNHLAHLRKELNLLFKPKKTIDNKTYELCTSANYNDLNKIVTQLLTTRGWQRFVAKDYTKLLLLENILDEILKSLGKKACLILIDKLDQSIAQTSTDIPRCEGCDYVGNVSACLKPEKKTSYCISAECNNICCYGCERFQAVYAKRGSSLRIYDKGRKGLEHVNVWQYIQQGLVVACYNIFISYHGIIRVYYTIRQEAFAREDGLFGDQAKKIRKTVTELWYSREEQKKIFFECIKNEPNEERLFDKAILAKNPDSFEIAFVGTDCLCHPFVKDLSESVFDSIYRHSFDRARDIQEYGKLLSSKIPSIKGCKTEQERGEKVKKYIEDFAAELAFSMGDGNTLSDKCYYSDKIKLLPYFWRKTDHFRALLECFDKNLLFPKEAKKICTSYNSKMFNRPNIKCSNNCQSCNQAFVHPFSMLYKMGMLGRITIRNNNEDDAEQEFIHSKAVTYINGENIMPIQNNTLYLLHPALTKSIDHYVSHIGHFNGFIIGKGLKVNKTFLRQLLAEYKKNPKAFNYKYFYGGHYSNPTRIDDLGLKSGKVPEK